MGIKKDGEDGGVEGDKEVNKRMEEGGRYREMMRGVRREGGIERDQ